LATLRMIANAVAVPPRMTGVTVALYPLSMIA
jgi:hypothetical protein